MNYWLVKSEGDCYSIEDFKKDSKTGPVSWGGIRNYQARNFMRDGMKVGDLVLYYHSNAQPSGVYGVARVSGPAHIDPSALDPKEEHFDPKAVAYEKAGKDPLWMCVDLSYVSTFARPVSLEEIKEDKSLRGMLVAQPGQRLSVMPVKEEHFKIITQYGNSKDKK